ncbi:MAG: NAD(P) transhydrogenase subunit alpha [Opitutales bacterium]
MKTLFAAPSTTIPDPRCPLSPDSVRKLTQTGFVVTFPSGLGQSAGFSDNELVKAGAEVAADPAGAERSADIVLRVRKPSGEEVGRLKEGALHLSFLDPFNEKELIEQMAAAGVSGVSLEMIPRTTLAQKMDALSSQANLAGYFAVIKAAEVSNRILPMMMTPAGTLSPAKVFVVGVGVAGLQAIATAKRLGAQVEAFDTRPVVEEQVKSLGAKFLKIDLGETGQTDQGYARELTPEQIAKQKEGMKQACARSDIVITTAKLFGRPAPKIIDVAMVEAMSPGSLLVDLAIDTGGNVEGARKDEIVETENGVKIIGLTNLEGHVAGDASRMLAANFQNFLQHFWDKEANLMKVDREDPIMQGALITHDGAIVHDKFAPKGEKSSDEA